ncbi:FGGY-family carbohydrate kinase [Mumia sp. ZJ1417]|nr:FGGY-family carbohydrate kinase [Mumia sp. ZJ1417]
MWVGLDLGTQSAKAVAVDETGTVHASAQAPITGTRDGVRHEQQVADWVSAARTVLGHLARDLGTAVDQIAGVALDGTSGTLAVLDSTGRATGPGIMYDDGRAAALADEVVAAGQTLWTRLGYRMQPSWALPKIVWLARQGLPPGARIVYQTDAVISAMTGTPVATDWSNALKSGFDLLSLEWPADVLTRLGVDPDVLPDVVTPGSVLGVTSAAWAEQTGIPAATPVVAGTTDGCAAQLGAGALAIGDWHSVIGTTLVLKGASASPVHDAAGAVYSHRGPEPGTWLPGGASSIGAGALSTLLTAAPSTHEAEARRLWDSGAAFPLVYPLTGTGERFPFVRPDAAGFAIVDARVRPLSALAGVDEAAVFLGTMVGVASVERLCFDILDQRGAQTDGRLSTSGGGSRSPLWNALRAAALDRPLSLLTSAEPATGMAVLARWGVGGGGESLSAVARATNPVAAVVEPRVEDVHRMDEAYATLTGVFEAKGWLT